MADEHDALFKRTFSRPELAGAELERLLPPALARRIDFSTLALESGEYHDALLDKLHSDLLFSAKIGGHKAYLHLLFEHQSTLDHDMPLRLLRYMSAIWDQDRRLGVRSRLPVILPFVLHHGPRGWSGATSLRELLDIPPALTAALQPFVPDFAFLLHDLPREDFEALRRSALPPLLPLTLFVLQHTRKSSTIFSDLVEWTDVARALDAEGMDDLLPLFSYLLEVGEDNPDTLRTWSVAVGHRVEEAFMTAARKLEERARAEGMAEGVAKGKAEGMVEGQRALLRRLLEGRFGRLSDSQLAPMQAATDKQLDQWADKVLTATSLEELFRS